MAKGKIVRSTAPVYLSALPWIVVGWLTPLNRLWSILFCACLSVAVYFVARHFFPGREAPAAPDSGDEAVNRQIREGLEQLDAIAKANAAIESAEISARLARMEQAGKLIFDALEKKPEKAGQVRKFMNYYLPTTVKLLSRYQEFEKAGVRGENMRASMAAIENSLEMIAGAFEKQLDHLYDEEALDITTDIQVLETMMADHQYVLKREN